MLEGHVTVITGPTAVGKTAAAVELALRVGACIVSADSRQFYRELAIGSAPPDGEQLAAVPHYFVQDRSVSEPLTAAGYAHQARALLPGLMERHGHVVVVGGSGLYIQALMDGLDALPTASPEIRAALAARLAGEGLGALVSTLVELDPVSAATLDRANPRRVLRALEVCLATGRPYSAQLGATAEPLAYPITYLALEVDRLTLYGRIDARVDKMVAAGLQAEAEALYPLRHLAPLRTVGYQEVFDHMDGHLTWPEAVDKIKQHTRNYAKRQLTWLRRQEGRG